LIRPPTLLAWWKRPAGAKRPPASVTVQPLRTRERADRNHRKGRLVGSRLRAGRRRRARRRRLPRCVRVGAGVRVLRRSPSDGSRTLTDRCLLPRWLLALPPPWRTLPAAERVDQPLDVLRLARRLPSGIPGRRRQRLTGALGSLRASAVYFWR